MDDMNELAVHVGRISHLSTYDYEGVIKKRLNK